MEQYFFAVNYMVHVEYDLPKICNDSLASTLVIQTNECNFI